MIGKNLILSLRTVNGLPQICYDLGNKILFEDKSEIKIELQTEIVTLKKSHYLNTHYTKKIAIYDNGDVFFAACTKHVKTDYIFRVLMDYACKKIDKRVNELENHFLGRINGLKELKDHYKKLIKSQKLVAA